VIPAVQSSPINLDPSEKTTSALVPLKQENKLCCLLYIFKIIGDFFKKIGDALIAIFCPAKEITLIDAHPIVLQPSPSAENPNLTISIKPLISIAPVAVKPTEPSAVVSPVEVPPEALSPKPTDSSESDEDVSRPAEDTDSETEACDQHQPSIDQSNKEKALPKSSPIVISLIKGKKPSIINLHRKSLELISCLRPKGDHKINKTVTFGSIEIHTVDRMPEDYFSKIKIISLKNAVRLVINAEAFKNNKAKAIEITAKKEMEKSKNWNALLARAMETGDYSLLQQEN
jgi:hypothetical protein